MVLTALLLLLVGVTLSVLGARLTFRRLGLDVRELLLYFGLAELPGPPVTPRARPRTPRPS